MADWQWVVATDDDDDDGEGQCEATTATDEAGQKESSELALLAPGRRGRIVRKSAVKVAADVLFPLKDIFTCVVRLF